MMRYAKICPNGHVNDEDRDVCTTCSEFLGHIESKPYSDLSEESPQSKGEVATAVTRPVADRAITSTLVPSTAEPVTQHMDSTHSLVIQIIGSEKSYALHHGWTIGQKHETNTAEVQVTGVQGVDTMHRRHCVFQRKGESWFVVAIDQRTLGREWSGNPTTVNGVVVSPGAAQPLRCGDFLTLGAVRFAVR